MSDINLEFTVSNNSIEFTVDPIDLTFTPQDIQLTINPSYQPGAGGNIGELQYNNGSLLAGIPTATYNGSNLSLGNVANLKITGGVNGYFLQTDGTGNLDWAAAGGGGGNGSPGGSNTQVQFNDAGTFNGTSNVVYNKVSGILGVYKANISNLTGNGNFTTLRTTDDRIILGNAAGQIGGGGSQAVAIGYGAGALNQGNDSVAIGDGAGSNNQGNYSIALGGGAGYQNQGNNSIILNASGTQYSPTTANAFFVNPVRNANTNNLMFYNNSTGEITYDIVSNINVAYATNSNFANFAGNVTVSSQPNITSLGTLTQLAINNNVTATRFTSNIATGTAPLTVSSNTVVANLNADLLDGYNSATTAIANTVAVRGANANLIANFFIGNGSALTGVVAGNANVANYAVNLYANGTYLVDNLTATQNLISGKANIANIYNTSGLITANRIAANVYFTGPTSAGTYASLPSASISAGGRSIINDANTTTFNAIVGGGGSNMMPVFSDGTNWRAG